jgi:hypothetical protein
MPTKPTTPQKPQARRRSKEDIEILEMAAGAYYLLLNAIMQNKRLSGDVVSRWLRAHGYVLMLKEQANATDDPKTQAVIKQAEAQLAQARAEIDQWENELMDLVRK